MKLCIGKRRIVIALAIVLLVGAGVLVYQNLYANKTRSSTGAYDASYNRFTKILTVRQVGSDLTYHTQYPSEPTFFWSNDGDQLAVYYAENRAEVIDLRTSTSRNMPAFDTVNEHLGEWKVVDEGLFQRANMQISAILDRNHVLITFSCPFDETGSEVSGWFVFDHSTHSIKELNAEKTEA